MTLQGRARQACGRRPEDAVIPTSPGRKTCDERPRICTGRRRRRAVSGPRPVLLRALPAAYRGRGGRAARDDRPPCCRRPRVHLGDLRRERIVAHVSLDVLRYILANTTVSPMAHLTCVGSSHARRTALIREFLDAGVRSFLALRGDPPADARDGDTGLGDLHSAGELVQLIHRVQAERVPYDRAPVPGYPERARGADASASTSRSPSPRSRTATRSSRSASQDIDTLLAKQAAGANLAHHPAVLPRRRLPRLRRSARRMRVSSSRSCPGSCRSPAPRGCGGCSN